MTSLSNTKRCLSTQAEGSNRFLSSQDQEEARQPMQPRNGGQMMSLIRDRTESRKELWISNPKYLTVVCLQSKPHKKEPERTLLNDPNCHANFAVKIFFSPFEMSVTVLET